MDNKNTLLVISAILEGTKKIVDNINVIINNDSSQISNTNHMNNAEVKRNIQCKFYMKNNCLYGEKCLFQHGLGTETKN